jgi:Transposase DNA-binding/Transposase DDE domain
MEKHVVRASDAMPVGGSIRDELAAGGLGDRRLEARRDRLVARLEAHPDRGFPALCDDDAEVEALYRFLRNPRVSAEALLAPHVAATQARCATAGEVLVVHDTTDMVFPGDGPRTGLTRLPGGRHGFVVHAALAVAADGTRAPLGVLRLHPWVRRPPGPGKRDADRFKAPDKESLAWRDGVADVRAALGGARVVHVMDRGADSYELLAAWVAQRDRFIVRLTHDRLVADAPRLSTVLATAPTVCQREVPLARRSDRHRTLSDRTRHPARAGRLATLRIAGRAVTLRRPRPAPGPATLTVHVVVVEEVAAPVEVEPVSWWLATTEPIDTADQLLRIVDAYRTRWLIEEYFKALKTGCAYEKRQLESLQTLLIALALLAPIAWRLLALRYVARAHPDHAATTVLSRRQVHLLATTKAGAALRRAPSVAHALAAVARLGGHLPHNGPPGWFVLHRGFQKLRDMELGWIAAGGCDQS